MTTLDRLDAKLRALRSWFEASHPPSYGIAHGFATAGPMEEPEVQRIEEEMRGKEQALAKKRSRKEPTEMRKGVTIPRMTIRTMMTLVAVVAIDLILVPHVRRDRLLWLSC